MGDGSKSLWLALCGAWLLTVTVADFALDRDGHPPVVLVGLVIAAPLLASIRLDARRTAFAGVVAILVAGALWHVNEMPLGADAAARLAALVCASAFGVLAARRRERLQALVDERRMSATRAEFLAAATTELVSSLDYAQTLTHVARAAVPALADRCVIDIAEDSEVRRVAEYGAAAGGSAVAVPIVWQDDPIGSITLANRAGSRRLNGEDRTLVVDLAARASRAVEHARVNLERDHIARTLQASLFPPSLPQTPGLELAARYRAPRGGAEVGGDFYDCFPLGAGEWVALVGDVQGKGVEAATVASLIHHSLRTIAVQQDSPARILEQLNDVVLRRREGCHGRFCTLALVLLREREDGGLVATAALAGHAQPLVRRANGTVEAVGTHGTLIGAVPDVTLRDAHFALAPGDLLLLFSDGVTESRRSGEMLGERGLSALLAGTEDDPEHVCERLVLAAGADNPGDDVALLAVRARSHG